MSGPAQRREARPAAEDIAIVGMAGIFPGSANVAEFWQNITGKVDCITDPPPDWRAEHFHEPEGRTNDRVYTAKGGYLGDLCRFDPSEYGIMPASVQGAEPDHFLTLRCAVEALRDAGHPGRSLPTATTGVILGRGLYVNRGLLTWILHGYVADEALGLLRQFRPDLSDAACAEIKAELKRNIPPFDAQTVPGLINSVMAGRIANRLGLHGPAYTVDAACASALVAVEHAIQALRGGQCDAVLAGGVQVSTPGLIHLLFSNLEALSPTGRIAPFSSGANGTLMGEGCGVIVLKRRSDAERDGDRIYSLIKGVGVSSDGRGSGLLAPRLEGQVLALQRAYAESGVATDSVELIEAHGTGTSLGDLTEIRSLTECFGRRAVESTRPGIAVGTVKAMIGHLLPASGIASLIKTSLALYHRVLPPMLHADEAHPKLELEQTPFYLSTQCRPWIHGGTGTPRRAGVNAFGFGGINAHAVLEEYPANEAELPRLESRWPFELVVISAEDREALLQSAAQWQARLQRTPDVRLLDVAASCAVTNGTSRLAIVAKDIADLVKKLEHSARLLAEPDRTRIQERSGIFWFDAPLAREGRVAFVFPGEGAQYVGMLADLCRHFPEVRREFDRTDAAFRHRASAVPGELPLSRLIFPPPAEAEQAEAELFKLEGAVGAVIAAERALLALLDRFGIRADAIVGHSSGEFMALEAAGAIVHASDDAAEHSIAHGAETATQIAKSGLVPPAVLLAIGGADAAAVEQVVRDSNGRLVVAMDNCPHQTVVAGDDAAIDAAIAGLRGKGGLCERLAWGRAYHTDAFAPACGMIADYYQRVGLAVPQIETWSCATAERFPADAAGVQELAVRQWRCAVRFRETVRAMHAAGVRVFVEIGPRGNLSAFIADTLRDLPHAAVPLDVPRKSSLEQLCRGLGMLVAHGVPVNLPALYALRSPRVFDVAVEDPAAREVALLPTRLPGLEIKPELAARWAVLTPSESVVEQAPEKFVTIAAPNPADVGPTDFGSTEILAAADSGGMEDVVEYRTGDHNLEDGPESELDPDPQPELEVEPVGDPRAAAYADFQRTMQLFLKTQEQVMLAQRTVSQPAPAAPVQPANDEAHEGNGHQGGDDRLEGGSDVQAGGGNHINRLANFSPPSAGREELLVPRIAPRGTQAGIVPAERAISWPFVQRILIHQARMRLVAECELDIERHRFLIDHTFFGRGLSIHDPELCGLPVMPLAMTMEAMAQAAAVLRPGECVVAMRNIQTMQWLVLEADTRQIRLEAEAQATGEIQVVVYEADREGMDQPIARAQFEFASTPRPLGPAVVPDQATAPGRWQPQEIYGRALFHGPAFQGITAVEACDELGVRALIHEPDSALLCAPQPPILPAALVDTAGQVPGMEVVGNWQPDDPHVRLVFPNSYECLEFAPPEQRSGPLTAVSTVEFVGEKVYSDVEMTNSAGEVVLRVMGRKDELVYLPTGLYHYWGAPRTVTMSRNAPELLAGIPGSEHATVCTIGNVGGPILVKRLWSRALASMILSRGERQVFVELKRPPVALAAWLLGRVVAKDAVRLREQLDVCMADIEIATDPHGRPEAVVRECRAPLVSLAHAGFEAVGLAADPAHFAGVGIDVEPLQPLSADVLSSFTEQERALCAAAAAASSESADFWPLAIWGAKEAVGKALGRGVLGAPRNIEVTGIDTRSGRLEVVLQGLMLDAFPAYVGRPLAAFARLGRKTVVTVCLLPHPEMG